MQEVVSRKGMWRKDEGESGNNVGARTEAPNKGLGKKKGKWDSREGS